MTCQADIEKLAAQKIAEAECLLQHGFFDGAYYNGGYAVELMLKCRVCKSLGIEDFFDVGNPKKKKFKNESVIMKPFKVHDLEQLIVLSGVYKQFETDLMNDIAFKYNWSMVSQWNENSRYLTGRTKTDAENFVISVKEVVLWIQKHL